MSDPEDLTSAEQLTPLTPEEEERAAELQRFWEVARARAGLARLSAVVGEGVLATVPPPVGRLATDPDLADARLALVLGGTVTAVSAPLAELEAHGAELPQVDDLWIAADGAGRPRALLRTTAVDVVRLGDVDPALVRAETGDDDVAAWRQDTAAALRDSLGTVPDDDVELVVERFVVLHP
ncbi:ASCH domain-containing protein [Actinotalea sp. Marseille-Q4924]|uniref:ASCH domain-containing protein n=1 Tax=Actinotalea sp. Marseille-Q4924 TaxID=2866571 RepID=UPI001CE3E5BB|nr:ASCH domain-containing protein [Actinotalea sp. Marseille-Q4924]